MKKAGLALLAVAAIGAGAAAIAWAAAGDSAVIHACVAKGSHLVRIPGANDGCRPNETGVDWNTAGPAGPKGDPGPQGPPGPAGAGPSEPNTRDVGFLHVETAQGTIDGEATEKGHEKWITVVGFDSDATAPTAATRGGAGSGKVQLKPIVITKPIDKSTPKLFQALVTGQHLPAVQLDLVRRDGAGGEEVFYTVKLKTVLVTDLHQFDEGKANGHALEQVTLDYDSIEITEGGSTSSGGGPTT
jgi:type VI secretion system secreted protein Hcp